MCIHCHVTRMTLKYSKAYLLATLLRGHLTCSLESVAPSALRDLASQPNSTSRLCPEDGNMHGSLRQPNGLSKQSNAHAILEEPELELLVLF